MFAGGRSPVGLADPGHEQGPRRSREQIETIVLDILARTNRPISAYDIANRASAAGERIVANQVYRTLGRLMEKSLVHRVESLSAYMLKQQDADSCLICDRCHSVQMLPNPELVARLVLCAERFGFKAENTVIETHGHCAECAPLSHAN